LKNETDQRLTKEEWIHCEDCGIDIMPFNGIKSVEEAQKQGHYKCMLGLKKRAGSNK